MYVYMEPVQKAAWSLNADSVCFVSATASLIIWGPAEFKSSEM